ncbi:unnamed protein product [Cuscuta campestris]|uniref:Secreted protein n=1 Tax=Cuscuta campestris TaxID=132261 RepID=A0A484M3L3_9ASTE|nr:unnamed protein product [Cuscuta campestris]
MLLPLCLLYALMLHFSLRNKEPKLKQNRKKTPFQISMVKICYYPSMQWKITLRKGKDPFFIPTPMGRILYSLIQSSNLCKLTFLDAQNTLSIFVRN